MKTKTIALIIFMTLLITSTAFTEEPTWLFTVPKSQSLKQGHYNIGLLYFDFGIAEKLELGIHGVKYSMGNLAFGASLYPFGSPYLVFSPDVGSSEFHTSKRLLIFSLRDLRLRCLIISKS